MMAEDLQLRKVFDDVMAQVEEAKDLRYESVESLSFLFDKVLDKAVDIVQNSCVKRVVGERSGREIFQVKAGRSTGARRQSKGWLQQCHAADGQHAEVPDEYLVLPFHYCSCHAFQFEVINRGEAFLCKHILAARLARALGMTMTYVVKDELLAQVLLAY
ncbi:zinc finger SWIM domain-containing protein [Chloropicon roscoffensis]|uniref:Zinc finger SWIM domain-containing protein n=1 Tax=Chloropicon roscoffensis TaxID=1461544 RepID=A0AAX4P830_9CHLO